MNLAPLTNHYLFEIFSNLSQPHNASLLYDQLFVLVSEKGQKIGLYIAINPDLSHDFLIVYQY